MEFTAPTGNKPIKIMLLGSGELGKEVAIEAQRLGLYVVAVDRYAHAPAHQVAHKHYVIDMKDPVAVLALIREEKPTYILPEIEAIAIEALLTAEEEGYCVIPNAKAVNLTMNRKGIRQFAAEELGLLTSRYRFVSTYEELVEACDAMGYPCVIKPVMSSSGHGQSVCRSREGVQKSWDMAKEARGDASELIVEEFITFDYEITLLTVRNGSQTLCCPPIGHIQQDGDYIFSWQPMTMSDIAIAKAEKIAQTVVEGLGGRGLFGVELFVKGDEVYFSEVSPRPHDTGMVTMVTQSQSEFALHVRAVLGLPLGYTFITPGASAAYKASGESCTPVVTIPAECFTPTSFVRVFGKPESHHGRRMAVVLTAGNSAMEALEQSKTLISLIQD